MSERGTARQPLDLVCLQESETKSLTRWSLRICPEPLENRLAVGLDLVETSPVQPPDLRARNAEDLAQHPIADVRPSLIILDELTELELDQVVDLLLREVLHVKYFDNFFCLRKINLPDWYFQ